MASKFTICPANPVMMKTEILLPGKSIWISKAARATASWKSRPYSVNLVRTTLRSQIPMDPWQPSLKASTQDRRLTFLSALAELAVSISRLSTVHHSKPHPSQFQNPQLFPFWALEALDCWPGGGVCQSRYDTQRN